MPQAGNQTVKKADGITDIVWASVQQSSGDRSPAVWRSNTVGTANAHRPTLKTSSRPNGPGNARRVEFRINFPESVVGGDGVTRITNAFILEGTAVIPEGMADAVKAEAVHQSCNLLGHADFKAQLIEGYASR